MGLDQDWGRELGRRMGSNWSRGRGWGWMWMEPDLRHLRGLRGESGQVLYIILLKIG